MSLRRLWCWWLALMADAPSMLRRNGVGWIFRLILYHLFVSILTSKVLCTKYRNPSKNQLVYSKALFVRFLKISSNWIGIKPSPSAFQRYSCPRSFSVDDFSLKKKPRLGKIGPEIIPRPRELQLFFWISVEFYIAWGIRLVWLSSKSRLFGWWISLFWFTSLSILTIKTYQNCLEPLRSCPRKSTKNPTRCWTPLRGWSCFMWIMERRRCSDKNGEFFLELLEICGKPVTSRFWILKMSSALTCKRSDMSQVPNEEKKSRQKRATCLREDMNLNGFPPLAGTSGQRLYLWWERSGSRPDPGEDVWWRIFGEL